MSEDKGMECVGVGAWNMLRDKGLVVCQGIRSIECVRG